MKIRMVEERTGGRWDGRAWPPVGGELYVEDAEGAAICGAGWAVPVPEDGVEVPEAAQKVLEETRTTQAPAEPPEAAPAPEPAPVPPAAPALAKPSVNAPKSAWVEYAAAHGMPEGEAGGMSKSDLIAALG
jgi:hypothetical protein